jgi:hypothetical protein
MTLLFCCALTGMLLGLMGFKWPAVALVSGLLVGYVFLMLAVAGVPLSDGVQIFICAAVMQAAYFVCC